MTGSVAGDLRTTDVRAITVRHPWCWSIEQAAVDPTAKLIENRSKGALGWSHRGVLFIHAGLDWAPAGAADPRVLDLLPAEATEGMLPAADRSWPGFTFGAITAVAELEDVHPEAGCCAPWGEAKYSTWSGDLITGVTHLVLADVRRLPEPVPARGALGLWRPDPHLVAAVAAQVPLSERLQP